MTDLTARRQDWRGRSGPTLHGPQLHLLSMRIANCCSMIRQSFGTRLCASRWCAISSAGLLLLWCVLTASVFAQGAPATPPASDEGVPVIYRGQEVVRIYRGVGGMEPAERARLASERLNQLVRDFDFDPARLTVSHRETHSELVHDGRVLGIVTDEDAQAIGQPRAPYARQVRDRLVDVISTAREELSVQSISIGLAWAALAAAILAVLLWLLARMARRVHKRVEDWVPVADRRSQGWTSRGGSGYAGQAEAAHGRRDRAHDSGRGVGGGVGRGGPSGSPLEQALRTAHLSLCFGTSQDARVRLPGLRAQSLLPRRHSPLHVPGLESRPNGLQGD